MPQQDVQLPNPIAAEALQLPEGVLLSPEPTAEELHMRRAKLALDIQSRQI